MVWQNETYGVLVVAKVRNAIVSFGSVFWYHPANVSLTLSQLYSMPRECGLEMGVRGNHVPFAFFVLLLHFQECIFCHEIVTRMACDECSCDCL